MDLFAHAKARVGLVMGFLTVLSWQVLPTQAAPSVSSDSVQFSSQELAAAVDSEVGPTPSLQQTSSSIAGPNLTTEAHVRAVYGKLPIYVGGMLL